MQKGGLVKGDGGSLLQVQLTDSETGQPIPLTGKTVTLRFSINKGPTVERTMTAMDQSIRPGWAQYQFTSTDLNASGEMKGEVRINAGQSDQLTTDRLFTEKVREPLP